MGAKDFKSSIVQKDRLLPGIHGLRGVAALAIVLFHLIHLADINPPAMFSFIGRDFGYAVHLFFILSAYSLMHSTESQVSRENWVKYYFIKRFFRIAPLFYSMIIFFMACGLFPLNNLKDFNNLLLNLTFTFGFAPETGILWGGWSVGVEMLFYAIFPTLILLIKSSRDALILLIFSTIVACGLRSVLHYQYLAIDPSAKYDWSYYSFAANFCFFSMGIYAYLLGQYYPKKSKIISTHIPLIAVIIFSLLFSDFDLIQKISSRLDIVLWGVGLTSLCIWQANQPSALISNKIFMILGERSYSIYLLHPIIIVFSKEFLLKIYTTSFTFMGPYAYFISLSILIAIILVVAEITYSMIELPGIHLGKHLVELGMHAK